MCSTDLACMFLECGRKPQNQERTHTDRGRTCKCHTERSQARNGTHDLLAVRATALITVPPCGPQVNQLQSLTMQDNGIGSRKKSVSTRYNQPGQRQSSTTTKLTTTTAAANLWVQADFQQVLIHFIAFWGGNQNIWGSVRTTPSTVGVAWNLVRPLSNNPPKNTVLQQKHWIKKKTNKKTLTNSRCVQSGCSKQPRSLLLRV